MLKKLILFLIRKRLGLKKNQMFQFAKQRNKLEHYWFGDDKLYKFEHTEDGNHIVDAHVSLNWIIDDVCKKEIVKIGGN